MNALVLNGSLKNQFHLDPFQKIITEELEKADWNFEAILLHQCEIFGCLGCFKCWTATPGLCIQQKDDAPGIVKKFIGSELAVFLTPLTFGGYSSELKRIIERMLGLLQPGATIKSGETHHLKRYTSYPSLLAVGIAQQKDSEEERIFKALVERHSRNFYPPKYRAAVFLEGEEDQNVRETVQGFVRNLESIT